MSDAADTVRDLPRRRKKVPDHSEQIAALRRRAIDSNFGKVSQHFAALLAELLEQHDRGEVDLGDNANVDPLLREIFGERKGLQRW